jgi:FKBP-type peptidyl-prolyl cis-trans isomerase 2
MKEGSIVKLDYDMWVHDEDSDEYHLYETTAEQVARDNDIFDDHNNYSPITAIVGKGNVLQGLDESLKGAELEKETEIVIPPDKAYGERRPEYVEFVKRNELESEMASSEEEDRAIYVGKHVHFKGRHGTVLMVTGRKCRLDFNHPLAGKTLKYRYVPREVIEEREAIAGEIAKLNYQMGDQFEFEFSGDELRVKLAEYCKFDPEWRMGKFQIISMLRESFPDIEKIVLMEEYPRPETPAADAGTEAESEGETGEAEGEAGETEDEAGEEEDGDSGKGEDESTDEEETTVDDEAGDSGEDESEESESIEDEEEVRE